jgi:hypothetical protein
MKQEIDKNFLIKAGVVTIGGLLIYRAIKNLFGSGTGNGNAGSGGGQTAPEAIDCNNIWNNPNLSYEKYSYYNDADAIFTAIQGTTIFVSWWEDDKAIEDILKKANNEMDVQALICAFGLRKPSLLSPGQPLGAFITEYLDESNKQAVNSYYRYKGILHQW